MYSVENSYDTSEAFGSIHSIINDTISSFNEFIVKSFELASNMMKELIKKLEKSSKISEEDKLIFLQHDFEPRRMQITTLEFQTSHSSIGYLYSQLDIILIRIADATKDLYDSELSLSNYKNRDKRFNKDIIKFKHYLINNYNFDFSSLEKYWKEIENFKKIRNYFVHQNGNRIADENFIEYVNSKQHLRIENEVLIVSKEYLIEISNLIKEFLFKVMENLYEKSKVN